MFSSDRRELCVGAFLLRLGLGVLMLYAGAAKFMNGLPKFHQSMEAMFGPTWMPGIMWRPYAYAIPYVEIVLGVLLIVGVLRFWVGIATALYILGLAFGMQVMQQHDTVADNYVYFAMAVAYVILSRHDGCCWRCRECLKGGGSASKTDRPAA